ncbi:hypothetical protein LZ31DRAFT_470869 [Colletotrichum somersetense]|nr:hypothetical protein LZ31DRAFT_470869 [Colletotrichum somersetense]
MARWNCLITWGLLFLCLQLAVAHVASPLRRQETEAGTSVTAIASSIQSESTRGAEATTSPASSIRSTPATTTASVRSSDSTASASHIPTVSGGNTFDNSSLFNTTIPEGQLPLQPVITPGWAVAGVILICTGVVYTLIGIKNTVLHNAFSVAYVVGLGISVLVVYVMVVPVSNASQGAYVVAAVLPAIFAGVLSSWFFKEITECLACALGGFCFAMWLLCLHDGGLLSGIAKVVFIIVFTLAGFATYFTRWTRDWALMVTISFTGATATVLGIDCFSRAGLKEFWAYVWALNDNLFPMGADTYPMTKGIRVEVAAIVVIFCIGIISQKRLWNVIKDRRAKRDEELAEAQRARDEEEANIGKELEAQNARERRAWEKVHGDYVPNGSDHDSGFGPDSESEKAIRYSQSTAIGRSQAPPVAEMEGSDVPPIVPPKPTVTGLMVSEKEKDGGVVTVRVAADDTITASDTVDKVVGETDAAQKGNTAVESAREVAPAPEVVPLPFRFPDPEETMARDKGDRSTIATFADDDEDQADTGSKRNSLAKRLSRSSAQLMRRVSQRTSASLRNADGRVDEELMVLRKAQDDDAGSIAATIDTQNDSGGSIDRDSLRHSIEVKAQLADGNPEDQKSESKSTDASRQSMNGDAVSKRVSAMSITFDVANQPPATDAVSPIIAETPAEEAKSSDGDVAKDSITSKQQEQTSLDSSLESAAPPFQKAKSTATADSAPVNLTQERLPPGFSNVALHYRTNEWAKHLSHAEVPEPDVLLLAGDRPPTREAPAPVHVEELQQTASSATPAPVPAKSPSPMQQRPLSNHAPSRAGHSRNNSYQSHRRGSSKTQFEPIAEEDANAPSKAVSTRSGSSGPSSSGASPVTPAAFERPPPPPGILSYDSPQSLIAQRSLALHNKTYGLLTGGGNVMPDMPLTAYRAASDSGSMYNYPSYTQQMAPDSLDDLPLSQRKEIIRRQSSLGTVRSFAGDPRPPSGAFMPGMSAESVAFDSHQPVRYSTGPSQEAREAKLASFRNSVRADLRASMATPPVGANGRDTTLSMYRSASATSLADQNGAREAEMQRNIDLQRIFMMSQKDAEAKRREKERLEKERSDQAFTARMQSGEMFDLHREAMRKMQRRARDA